jgi:hypothetical protein
MGLQKRKKTQQSLCGLQGLMLGHKICAREGPTFLAVKSRKGASELTRKSFGIHDFGEVYVL